MANEYLKRTPTSTGNRKVFTWSGWVKSNKDNKSGDGNAIFMCASANNGSQFHRTRIGRFVVSDNDFGFNHYDGANDNYGTQSDYRDHSSWTHYMCSVDTTQEQTIDRVKLYVNGVYQSDLETVTAINQNLETYMNRTAVHFIGADGWTLSPNNYSSLLFLDIFFVDGQVLTPEVFGYNKDGRGYISAGSSQATDFRNGQWVPKKPKLIIDEINASGGFGVNGFYLPMNSSNNFGADFHTTPNTILKLKDNLPQPKAEIDGSGDYSGDIRDDLGGLPFPGVVKFDGSGDNISISSNGDFAFGTGAYTVEMWINFTTLGGQEIIKTTSAGQFTTGAFTIYYDSGVISVASVGGAGSMNYTWSSATTNRWYHIAVCRNSSNNQTLYIDGVSVVNSTTATNNFIQDGFCIGDGYSADFNGYISNLRIIKGTALYTENFTPPTQPLQKTTDTVLLCCNSKTDPTNEETGKTITKNGDVYATTSELTDALVLAIPGVSGGLQNGFGDYSAAIRGYGTPLSVSTTNSPLISSDHSVYYGSSVKLVRASSQDVYVTGFNKAIGTGDFTIEGWYKFDSRNEDFNAFNLYEGSTRKFFLQFRINNPTFADLHTRFIGTGVEYNSGDIGWSDANIGNWYHVAAVRDNGTFSMFLNGVCVGVHTNHTENIGSVNTLRIGYMTGDSTKYLDGYFQDVRFYTTAKYKGGFDVPKPYTPVGIGTWRAVPDTTANNFATLNPLQVNKLTFSDGNLSWSTPINTYSYGQGTISVPKTGKWVFEGRFNHNTSNNNYNSIGVGTTNPVVFPFTIAGNYGINDAGPTFGQSFVQNGVRQGSITLGSGDIIQVLIDRDNNQMNFVKNGTLQTGTGSNVTIPSYVDLYTMIGEYNVWGQINFGQNPTFSGKIGNNVRINSSNGSWDQTPNTGLHNDWTISNDGRNLDVVVSSGYYARAYLYLDPNEKYLLSFDYVSGPANLGVLTDTKGYLTSVNGSVSPNGLSQGNSYVFEISNANWVNITGFNSQTYNIDNIYLTRVVPGYSDSNGKGEFRYEPPAGFLALCEDNLPTPAIQNPGEHFKTVLWTGDGLDGRSITGVGFQPDLVWIKRRNGASDHVLQDSVRGFGPTTKLSSSSTQHENDTDSQGSYGITDPQWGYLNSVDTDGFSLNASTNGDQVNRFTGDPYVAWCWKAGGAAVENTDGSITSQVSVNQDAGFSIVSTNGSGTAGHGLNATPQFIISKRTTLTSDWSIQHHQMMTSSTGKLLFTTAGVVASSTPYMFNANDTTFEPIYTDPSINYCWAEIEGFSKFGSYVGNGDPDGPFVYCGFKPAFILLKPTNLNDNWLIADNARSSTNINQTWLYPNSSTTEGIQNGLDFLSNGFKLRNSNGGRNGDGITYIFAAFAESPFQYANSK